MFSIALCHLCVLCVSVVDDFEARINHRDTENTEGTQRLVVVTHYASANPVFENDNIKVD